tara:strand:+ start:60 stop:533 length:474 start_codon:yes stop_codon:yes gene_type:complete
MFFVYIFVIVYGLYQNTPTEYSYEICNVSSYVIPKYDCGYIIKHNNAYCSQLFWYDNCNISDNYNWHWHTKSICSINKEDCMHNITTNQEYYDFFIIDIDNETLFYNFKNKTSLFDWISFNKDNIVVFICGVIGFFFFFLCIGVKVFYIQEERRLVT